MKTLYLECAMGASGDMLMGALASLLDQPASFVRRMNALGLPGVRMQMEPSKKCGVVGTHISVTVFGEEEESHDAHEHTHEHEHAHTHEHEHAHTHAHTHAGMRDIEAIIRGLDVSDTVKRDALAVYDLIAQAESEAHGQPVEAIHFHEVGALDAVADIVGVSILMETLAPDKVIASPINTGFGKVRCAHGILPVPAPATAHILRGVPIYAGRIEGELCTPTGAALIRHFATEYGSMPVMAVGRIGYGMGMKDFPAANCVRAFLGEIAGELPRIAQLQCNLDDMTPEAIGFALGALLDHGALDAFTTPIQMKKNRPAVMLTCLCREPDAERFATLMLKHTTTLGVRKCVCERYTLTPSVETRETSYGPVRVKRASGYGVTREKPEYEDVARIAKETDAAFTDVFRALDRRDDV